MSAHERFTGVIDAVLVESHASIPFDILIDVRTRVGYAAAHVRIAHLKEVRSQSTNRVLGSVGDQLADHDTEEERHQFAVELPEERSLLFFAGQILSSVVNLDADDLERMAGKSFDLVLIF